MTQCYSRSLENSSENGKVKQKVAGLCNLCNLSCLFHLGFGWRGYVTTLRNSLRGFPQRQRCLVSFHFHISI